MRKASPSQVLAALALVLAGFVWGLVTARLEAFPYGPLRAVWSRLGGSGEDPTAAGGIDRPGSGIWHRVQTLEGDVDMATMQELAEIPYLDGYQAAPDAGGVVVRGPEAWDGLNLVVSGHAPEVELVDMAGSVLHRWRHDPAELREELAGAEDLEPATSFFRRAHVLPDGGLYAIYDGVALVKLDRDSRVLWESPGRYHHDLHVAPDGTVYALSRAERREHDRLELAGPIEEDFVCVLTPEGALERRVSVLECFLRSDYASVLAKARREGDLLHTNTLELMDGRFAERHPMFEAGKALVSCPTVNTIAVLDLERETVDWALSGLWKFQHQPTVVEDGRLLVFDNLGAGGDSKVIEIDPLSQQVVWAFRSTPERRFRSHFLGSCQRLPNGDTLITESTAGRAFEVTPGGDVVWEYVNPRRAGPDGGLIASLLEVVRLDRTVFSAEFTAVLSE